MKILDCKGLNCPQPVILTKKELDSTTEQEIEVIVDNEVAKENVSKFAKSQNYDFNIKEENGIYKILIKKEVNSAEENKIADEGKLVIVITTNKFGEGDEALSTMLMKSYIYALSESERKIDTLIFINNGVKLVTTDSEHVETLKVLESKGTEILSCGACLDFYNLKEKLATGSISNMYTIVEKMNNAASTIKI